MCVCGSIYRTTIFELALKQKYVNCKKKENTEL